MAPLYNVAYDMGIGIKAFAVAILGGLTNPWGVVIAGLAMAWSKHAPPPGSARAALRS
jgi:branched-subunit amino acid ABC-type transport system permease component